MRDQVLIIHCGCLVVGIYSFYILSIEWAYIWNTIKLNIWMPMILEKIGDGTALVRFIRGRGLRYCEVGENL